jgi:hypothetical protein
MCSFDFKIINAKYTKIVRYIKTHYTILCNFNNSVENYTPSFT